MQHRSAWVTPWSHLALLRVAEGTIFPVIAGTLATCDTCANARIKSDHLKEEVRLEQNLFNWTAQSLKDTICIG